MWPGETSIDTKLKAKYDPQLASELLDWIRDLTGENINIDGDSKNFYATLCDGKLLCKLINTLQPGTIPEKKINESKMAFKKMENINYFLESAQKLGVPSEEIFQTVDLWEQQNLTAVCICLQSLARKVS
ncbi:transgelin-3-like isoform X2 [Limulus polyphemus]|uniref:Transgelin-3-like isoform X2 n=1 Tax=Limulus polyphemus TaxID=6850 RepID=A0ABM1T692_LIMPO|nr:transgelin-3-like isoform X2 [Limulus polyphemus]